MIVLLLLLPAVVSVCLKRVVGFRALGCPLYPPVSVSMRSWCPCKYERAAVVTSFTGLRFSPVQRLVSDSSTHLHARPAAPQPIVASKLQPGTRRTPYTFKVSS